MAFNVWKVINCREPEGLGFTTFACPNHPASLSRSQKFVAHCKKIIQTNFPVAVDLDANMACLVADDKNERDTARGGVLPIELTTHRKRSISTLRYPLFTSLKRFVHCLCSVCNAK